ncbi:MAG: isoleucine--tRNA ligase [Rhodothermales bacterium]
MPSMIRFAEAKNLILPEIEEEILDSWKENHVFSKSLDKGPNAPTFTFYEGPPTANGRPGIHHVMARTIKDAFCRYKTMKGFRVQRKGGWDTHGLPVEIEVEKELGLVGREQVAAYGIEKYNAACRASVLKYKDLWDSLTVRMAYWVDLDNPYVTFRNEYIESVWWLLKQIYDKGLIYKGHKIQWYSPGSGTVLSSHEVSLGYKDVQDPSVFVRFQSRDDSDTFFLAWTTTPWTLISNVALAVGPSIDYVKVKVPTDDGGFEYLILADARLGALKTEYDVVERMKGSELVGRTYVPLYDYFLNDPGVEAAWRIVSADYVSTEDGTGIVHTAPAFGAEDYESSVRWNLPVVNPVRSDGRFSEAAPLVAGQWFKDADKTVIRDLRDRGLLLRQETIVHSYPHDWRKGTPLMSYPVESWFIRTTAIKDRLVQLNDEINWQPASIGTGRFGEWLRNNVDWALSRRRFWGTPLPIWESDVEGSEYREIIGSVAELAEKCGGLPADFDLHRPFIDELTWPSPDGGTMRRVEDLIDVWFDSGAMPFAQWHYPFENAETFEASFPADFIAEGVDQTRGWFYTLHAIAALVRDDVAYRNVVVNGLVLDANGEKMSKSKGNAVDPFDVISRKGADVVRWYMMSNAPPWENIRFSERGLDETFRKFFSTIHNVYSFFATYANIDGFDTTPRVPVSERQELDRWIISRMHSTVAAVDDAYATYNPTRAARYVEEFVDDLSNWYIRRSRRRFWKEADTGSGKTQAYQTVFECLVTIARLSAPIAPMYSDWLYSKLKPALEDAAESVHTAAFPTVEDAELDEDLERRIHLARSISSAVLALRNASQINVRQPLSRILVVTGRNIAKADVDAVRGMILDEVNVKSIEYVDTSSGVVNRTAKANYQTLGRRLGKRMKAAAAAIAALDDQQITGYIDSGRISLDLDDGPLDLGEGDIDIVSSGVDGWLVQSVEGSTVALDATLTKDLLLEGISREIVNRIQNLRKQADYDVTDRIRVEYATSGVIRESLGEYAEVVRNETLALELHPADEPAGDLVESFEIEDQVITIGVRRTSN